jgi:hypothetical protein
MFDPKPRVFISHTSKDKPFVEGFSWDLRRFRINVWYDDWEIDVGDSIVEKVFSGLAASDTLIVVLSPDSVASRWVNEELNVAVMRRLSESNIRILPVLIATCDIPTALRHIRYADFREDQDTGLLHVMDALAPGHMLWGALGQQYDHFCLLCDQLASADLNSGANDIVQKIHSLLESALDLRTEIEFRRARQKMSDLRFFDKIKNLVEKGIDVRSQTWNEVVYFRATLEHRIANQEVVVRTFASMLGKRYESDDLRSALVSGTERLKVIMHKLCHDRSYPREDFVGSTWGDAI